MIIDVSFSTDPFLSADKTRARSITIIEMSMGGLTTLLHPNTFPTHNSEFHSKYETAMHPLIRPIHKSSTHHIFTYGCRGHDPLLPLTSVWQTQPKKEEIVNEMRLLCTNCAADNNLSLLANPHCRNEDWHTKDKSPHSVYFLIH